MVVRCCTMQTALQQMTKHELIELLQLRDQRLAERDEQLDHKQARIVDLEFQVKELQRLVFGAKRERFISEVPEAQLTLGLDTTDAETAKAVEAEIETITYERKKAPRTHPGRMELPSHLPVVETVIEPDEDTSQMQCIGREVSDELELRPAAMYVNRTTRPKYAAAEQSDGTVRIVIAPMPKRPIDKCIAGVDLLTTIVTDKHVHHMPVDRQLKRFSMLGVNIPATTVESWQALTAELLRPLYGVLRASVLKSSYLQVDETGLAVQDRTKSGTTHKGFLWGYHAPLGKLIYFEYQKGRGQVHCRPMLESFKGFLQTDDYQVYHQHKARDGVVGLACWAHARRTFEKALDTDRKRASVALQLIQKLYAVEREARDGNLSADERKELRLQKSLPVLNTISAWLVAEMKNTLPRSPIGKAMQYCVRLWDELMAYLHNGHLEIDNNLMENAIRPVALGRKNWLFAGSHAAAENIAMYRSFFATCHANGVNPYDWLRTVLLRINSTAPARYHTLLPHRIDLSTQA